MKQDCKMQRTINKRKKKKKKEIYILQNVYNNQYEEILDTKTQILYSLKRILKNHIGESNHITPYELFYLVYNIRPDELNIYKRNYWWNVIKGVLRELRRKNECFTIIKGSKIFVLSNNEELNYFIKVTNKHMKALDNLKLNARDWIKKKKYNKI